MAIIDDKTPNLGLLLPHENNDALDDIRRIKQSLNSVDQHVSETKEAVAQVAARDLGDNSSVTLTAPKAGDVLRHDGQKWKNAALTSADMKHGAKTLETVLGEKADAAATTEALDSKAEAAATTEALSKKADATATAQAIAETAETLALKADRAEAVPIFDTVYTTGVIGVADSGKSYLMADIATVPVLSIDDVANLPFGWSITVRVMGAASGFQTAKLHIASGAGVFLFHGGNHGANFFLFGRGEAYRVTRIQDGVLLVQTLASPEPRVSTLFHSATVWNSGLTAWSACPLNSHQGDQSLIQMASGGGKVAVSGHYNITCRAYFHVQTSGKSGTAYAQLIAGGQRYGYEFRTIYYPDSDTLTPGDSIFLYQGSVINFSILSTPSDVWYHPGNSEVTVALTGRPT